MNFALIGRGKWGENYENLLKEIPDVSLQAIVTASSGNLESVLQNPDINCVVIATPPKTHFDLAKAALETGKHVLLEKPMVMNLKEAEELKRVVENSDRIFMVGFQYLFNDYIRYLKKEIENGAFGEIKKVSSEHFQSPPRTDMNSFWDAAPHPLSIFQYYFEPTKILNVEVETTTREFTSVKVQFDRGPLLSIKTSWPGERKVRKLTLKGEKQTAILDETLENQKLRFSSGLTPDIKAREPLRSELEHFINCIKNKNLPLTNVNFGYQITNWLDKISKRAYSKQGSFLHN